MKPKFENGLDSGLICPACGGRFVVRTNRENGSQFLGCDRYPECTEHRGIPEEWIMRQQGQQELFDAK